MLDRLEKYIKQRYIKLFSWTVGPSSNEFAFQFGLAFCISEKHQNIIAEPRWLASVQLNELATRRKGAVTTVTVDRQRPVGTVTICL